MGSEPLREGKGNAMATPDYVLLQLHSLERQIEFLRLAVNQRSKKQGKSLEMRDLFGIWRKKIHFSDQEIDEAKKSWIKPFPA
ncbi:MAG: hypothetical protein A3G34_10975 [Candidatus Lindowbacteria bacterium RIFCSPLOWO2_12_FULL_62_27]|nr:MAG: hypothetical protein A3I06_12030 [Candidatus Lindowbacteria bacterium RIFCSPLOWO2_02_FULL_62_12]OGH60641.1 MAG: hypothetical protein A3G34_10975 [Candidatus Lindowbacteria bacterium RIFCSPLOWO2_12_FULL_62_27]